MDIPPVISPASANVPPPKRHGCLLTWLLLMLAGDAFTILFSVVGPLLSNLSDAMAKATANGGPHIAVAAGTLSSPQQPAWFIAVTIVMCLVDVVAIGGVFYWRRWGFYASVGASAVLVVLNVFEGSSLVDPLMCLISPALLYATLKMGGENCGWRRLK